jgi:hypothetical protein
VHKSHKRTRGESREYGKLRILKYSIKVNILAVFQSILVFEGVRGLDKGV